MASPAQIRKAAVLILQALINLLYGLLMAATRKPRPGREPFFAPSAVLCFESIKFTISVCGVVLEKYNYVQSSKDIVSRADDVKTSAEERGPHHAAAHKANEIGNFADDEKRSPARWAFSHRESLDGLSKPTLEARAMLSPFASDFGKAASSPDPALLPEKGTHIQGKEDYKAASPFIESTATRVRKLVCAELFTLSAFRLSVPGVMYVAQNNLFWHAGAYLTATEFQVFSQAKLITTAILSVVLLGKALNRQHWIAIILLVPGIIATQLFAIPRETSAVALDSTALTPPVPSSRRLYTLIGIAAVLGACTFSGLAAVLLEKLYKDKKGFWTLNAQLAFFGLIPALTPVVADCIARRAFDPLRNFDALVWLLVIISAVGGFSVALVMRYADSILKGYALSAALVATMLISAFVTQETYFSILESMGMLGVVTSMVLYAKA